MTLFNDPAVVEAIDPDGERYGLSPLGLREILTAAVAALDRESLIEKATAHFERADDHLSTRIVCRGRAVGLLVDLGLIEEEDG